MHYEQLAEFLEEKYGCYFQGLYYQVPSQDLKMGLVKAEMEVETKGVEARTSTTDGVEARNSTTKGVEARTITKEKGKEKTKYKSDDDSDYHSNKSVVYLSPGKDELIKLRNRMKANRKAKAKAKDKSNEEINEPTKENNMLADNIRGETFKEHDIYMNELLKSLKTADKDRITEDPFISIEKHVERYPMYDETTHWRLRKPKFKECLTYYALANGFSLWHERSGEVRVIAKCRQRPPRVFDPKKDEHTCVRNFNFGALVNYKWIEKIFSDKIRAKLDIRLCDIADLVMKKYKCKVSLNQCINAKKYALTYYEKSMGEHYFMLRFYGKAILDSNPESTVKLRVTVNPDGKTYFDRFYVCFVRLAYGWKASCRKIIALDGRPRKKQPVDDFEDVDVVQRGLVRDEGASRTRGGAIGSRGRGGAVGSRGGASGLRGRGTARSRGGTSGSIGRGASGSKRRPVSTVGTQIRQCKKKVGTTGFAKWFGLQDEPEHTQVEPQQTQHKPEQIQVKE
nr:hypothetical protein [Tanacetum cinerariifolium]